MPGEAIAHGSKWRKTGFSTRFRSMQNQADITYSGLNLKADSPRLSTISFSISGHQGKATGKPLSAGNRLYIYRRKEWKALWTPVKTIKAQSIPLLTSAGYG